MNLGVLVEELCYTYGQHWVLNKVSFTLDKGSFTGIIGPNGGGKTTLLKLLMGLLKPSSGVISLFGSPPEELKKHIAYVPQGFRFDRLFPISVMEVVLEGCLGHDHWWGGYSKMSKEKAMEVLAQVGMDAHRSHPLGMLSGGQLQRVLIARALASNPSILFLDEPTAGVDARAEKEVYDILLSLKGKLTMLMVTHHLQRLLEQVDNVLCVSQQATLLTPEQVCSHFAAGVYDHPHTGKGQIVR